ncbi:CoA pyrophosphatase [Agitococcus lubricus]|uniref:NUDIX domain-containing protein n=1 Tax=Agitococcus lubricus TaxID=1077255 RepID=A0A2T5J2G2_9GAMM|nr:CoA pyrophosphatase [Agitococcus lubricus]PTQ90708.1 NUDIX domain-containing protein [Agitococcus lubricus]
MLQQLLARLPQDNQTASADAAVLMAMTREDIPRLILTQRAAHLNSHASEVAFPGGKRDKTDSSLIYTALREAQEEIALNPQDVDVVGELGIFTSRVGVKVKPIIGLLDNMPTLTASPDEIDSIFTVPLDVFLQQKPNYQHKIKYMGLSIPVPSFNYQGYVIWGLTGFMIVEFMRRVYDADIDWRWPNPLKR